MYLYQVVCRDMYTRELMRGNVLTHNRLLTKEDFNALVEESSQNLCYTEDVEDYLINTHGFSLANVTESIFTT